MSDSSSSSYGTDRLLQSIIDVADVAYSGDSWKEVQTYNWVLSKIDFKKLTDRVSQAMQDPTKDVKVVLLEYNYTTRKAVEGGTANVCDKLPSGVLVHDAMYRKEFQDLLEDQFCVNDDVVIYRRRKITNGGHADPHRMQLVLHFKPGALVVIDDASSMPPLISQSGDEL